MKQVLMFTSLKGGVGKTTAASACAFALSFLGKRVLCVDLDFGVRGLDLALGAENFSSSDVLEVIRGGLSPAQEAVCVRENLWFLPAPALFNTREAGTVDPVSLSRFLEACKASFDVTLLDLPAGGGELFLPLAKSEHLTTAVIVSTAESAALRAAEQTAFEIRAAGKARTALVINRFHLKQKKGEKTLLDMAKEASVTVLGVVPEDALVSEAYDAGVALTRLVESPASVAYWNIAHRLLSHPVPLFSGVVRERKRKKLAR